MEIDSIWLLKPGPSRWNTPPVECVVEVGHFDEWRNASHPAPKRPFSGVGTTCGQATWRRLTPVGGVPGVSELMSRRKTTESVVMIVHRKRLLLEIINALRATSGLAGCLYGWQK